MKNKISTMGELAKKIGVSRPTLSRYFQDSSLVKDSTRMLIEEALQSIDYVPNFFARNLKLKQTGTVGVVIPHMNDFFYTSLLEAVQRAAEDRNLSVIIQNSRGRRDTEARALEMLRSMNAEGVMIAPIGANSDIEAFERINAQMPLVLIDTALPRHMDRFSLVGTNNRQAMRLLVDYLVRTGPPPIFLELPTVNNNAFERSKYYSLRMQELGHEPVTLTYDGSNPDWNLEDYGYARMKAEFMVGRHVEATVLCANDRLAVGALRAANEFGLFGLQKGERSKFRVAGHDNHPLSAFFWPALTTATQDIEQMARTAVSIIVERSRRGDQDGPAVPVRHLLDAQLIVRDSA